MALLRECHSFWTYLYQMVTDCPVSVCYFALFYGMKFAVTNAVD